MLDEINGFYIMCDGTKKQLTEKETKLLECMIKYKFNWVPINYIIQAVYGKVPYHTKISAIRSLLTRLRKKIGDEILLISETNRVSHRCNVKMIYIGEK